MMKVPEVEGWSQAELVKPGKMLFKVFFFSMFCERTFQQAVGMDVRKTQAHLKLEVEIDFIRWEVLQSFLLNFVFIWNKIKENKLWTKTGNLFHSLPLEAY